MKTSTEGRKFIESWEGLVLVVSDDGYGTPTGGYGHTNAAGPPSISTGQHLTQAEADEWLANDLIRVERKIDQIVTVPLNQNQYDALVSFEFNTGALFHSTTLHTLNSGDYKAAADALLLYDKAHKDGVLVVSQGLVNRRNAEKALFLKPVTSTAPTPSWWSWLLSIFRRS